MRTSWLSVVFNQIPCAPPPSLQIFARRFDFARHHSRAAWSRARFFGQLLREIDPHFVRFRVFLRFRLFHAFRTVSDRGRVGRTRAPCPGDPRAIPSPASPLPPPTRAAPNVPKTSPARLLHTHQAPSSAAHSAVLAPFAHDLNVLPRRDFRRHRLLRSS